MTCTVERQCTLGPAIALFTFWQKSSKLSLFDNQQNYADWNMILGLEHGQHVKITNHDVTNWFTLENDREWSEITAELAAENFCRQLSVCCYTTLQPNWLLSHKVESVHFSKLTRQFYFYKWFLSQVSPRTVLFKLMNVEKLPRTESGNSWTIKD